MAAGETQKFCLRWNDFRSSVTAAFEGLRHDEELVDITLCCEGRKIKAHRMMLSACSPFFRDLLRENPCQHPVFFLRDVTYADLWAVIEFVYRGEVRVAQSSLASFLRTAEMLQLRGLTDDEPKSPGSAAAGPRPPSVSPRPGGAGDHPAKRRCSPPPQPLQPPPAHPLSSPAGAKRRKQADPEPARTPEHPPLEGVPREELAPPVPVKTELPDTGPPPPPPAGYDVMSEYAAFAGLQQMEAIGRQAMARHDLAAGLTAAGMSSRMLDQEQYAPGLLLAASAAASLEPRGRHLYACDTCGKQYVTPGSLRKHRKVHLGKTHCQLCDKVFSSVYRLQYHVNTIHAADSSAPQPAPQTDDVR